MSREKRASPPEEKGESAPLWMISFADMISLLMAFFVMLLTMSTEKSGKLCNENEGVFEDTVEGFRRSVDSFGLPGLFGVAEGEPRQSGNVKVYYPIEDGNDPGVSMTKDASEERLRRLFARLQKETQTREPELRGDHPNFMILPVTFGRGQHSISPTASQALRMFTNDLVNFGRMEGTRVYVVGLAPDELDEKQRWILSARRAQAVADYIRLSFPSGKGCRVFSWGAASGGDWVKQDGEISLQSQIAVAIVRSNS